MRRFRVPTLALLYLALSPFASGDPPSWWSQAHYSSPELTEPDIPPVLNTSDANNRGPANIGQAKHMARSALAALREVLPDVANQIEADLVGPGKPIPHWNPPADQNERDKHHAPLLTGQLKAIAHPFYNHLHAAAPEWLASQRTANGTEHGGIFPWTDDPSDDNHHAVASVGQLKAVFSLRFESIDSDSDGLTNAEENLLGSNPNAADTSGDGIDDFWLAMHGFDPTTHHGSVIFPGSEHTVVSAFRMGVQSYANASPEDFDADGVTNHLDADPHENTIRWRRGASPAWMLRYPTVSSDDQFLSLSSGGTLLYHAADWASYSAFTPHLDERILPADPPGGGTGFYGSFGMPLHGDRVFGWNLLSDDPFETEWAHLHLQDSQVVPAQISQENPPETVFDATNLHVSGVGGGFGVRADGVTPLFGDDPGRFESNENAISHGNNGIRYWTYHNGAYDNGRAVTNTPMAPGFELSSHPSATVQIPNGQESGSVHHLIPTPEGLYVAEDNNPFELTNWPAPLVGKMNATRQGWVLDHTFGSERLWLTGHWHPFNKVLSPRTGDDTLPQSIQVLQARDTGVIAAAIRYAGDDWKHAVLTPVHLQILHPQQNTLIPWNDYLPGYQLDEPMLCKAQDSAHPRAFGNLAYDGPQEIGLRFSGPALLLADEIDLQILQVTAHHGWSGNAGDSEEEDLSFSPDTDHHHATASVENGAATIPIHCKDYGAWAKLRLILKKNGSPIHPDPILITLPHDSNGDRIADHWQRPEVRLWNQQFRQKPGDPDYVNPEDSNTWAAIFGTATGTRDERDRELADSDGPTGPMPAMADRGDGLTAHEEYRGFFLDGGPRNSAPRHRRLSASRKDLLVECSEMEGIGATVGSIMVPGFTDSGNNADAFAQAYSVTSTMRAVALILHPEGPASGNSPRLFPGAAIDSWWVVDVLDDAAGSVVYENGNVRSAYKYSGSYYDQQSQTNRSGWLSVAWDEQLRQVDPDSHSDIYGTGSTGVGILANHENRNVQCGHFIKLALQGRKGKVQANGNLVAPVGEAARERDETAGHEPERPRYQGAAVFVNSLSEEQTNGLPWSSQAAFESQLAWSITHELGHLFIRGRGNSPFDGGEHISGGNSLMGDGGASTKLHEDEIESTNLRLRASIKRSPNGEVEP